MTTSPSLEQVKDLLADGQTEAAADLLLQFAKSAHSEHFCSALLLKNRLETLQHKVIEGVVSQSEENLEWARISKGVVNLVTQIEKGEMPLPEEALLPKPPRKQFSFPKKILWAIPVLILLGIAVPKFLDKSISSPPQKETTVEPVKYTGRALYQNNNPAANARLLFRNGDFSQETFTDTEGRFTVDVPVNITHVTLEVYVKEKLAMPPRTIMVDANVFSHLKIPD